MSVLRLAVALAFLSPALASGATSLDREFTQTVRPAIAKYCVACHSGTTPAAQFDLKAYDTIDSIVRDYPRWDLVLQRLTAGEMPPKPAAQPSTEVRRQMMQWIQAI